MTRPLIFLDVDGVLLPFRPRPNGPTSGDVDGNPLLERLNPDDGRRLLALRGDLVWATTWMAEANEVLAPRLGLPVLPVVEWPDDDDDARPGVHWKTVCLTRWAAGRPFVWLDDEPTDADRRWVATHHPAPALLHRVDRAVGLTDADFDAVDEWLTVTMSTVDSYGPSPGPPRSATATGPTSGYPYSAQISSTTRADPAARRSSSDSAPA